MTATIQPLDIDVTQFGVSQQHVRAIESACQRGLPELPPGFVSHDGTMVCVGSGPSLPTYLDEIKIERTKGRPILAVNGAHDLLCEHDCIPDLFLTTDPRDLRHNLARKNDQTVYLLASRCAPEVFDHLKDCRVMLWHSNGHQEEIETVRKYAKLAIGGGSTSGLRAIAVGWFMGFRNFLLFGYDSCCDAQGRKRFYGGPIGMTKEVIVGGKKFVCNMAMAAQANEFQQATYGWLPDVHIESRGPGLISAILEERKKMGYRV